MKLSNIEILKLFNFILKNKDIIISDNGLFNRDTLMMIRAIVRGKVPNDFILTEEQEKLLIDAFLNSDRVFDNNTPSFILKNFECIKAAILRGEDSIKVISDPDILNYLFMNNYDFTDK